MKGKKLAALILAVVMALTMLTACGGGGGSAGGDLDLATVNSLLKGAGCDVTVNSNASLATGVRVAARGVSNGSIKSSSQVNQTVAAYLSSYKSMGSYWISEASVLAGGMTVKGSEALGSLNTPEKLAAADVMYFETRNRDYTYSACGAKCTDPQGNVMWVITVVAQ